MVLQNVVSPAPPPGSTLLPQRWSLRDAQCQARGSRGGGAETHSAGSSGGLWQWLLPPPPKGTPSHVPLTRCKLRSEFVFPVTKEGEAVGPTRACTDQTHTQCRAEAAASSVGDLATESNRSSHTHPTATVLPGTRQAQALPTTPHGGTNCSSCCPSRF